MNDLAPELLLDDSNPANDRYYRELERLRALVNTYSAKMRPRQVETVRLHFMGETPKQIAEKHGVTPNTVYQRLAKPEAKRLFQALQVTQQLVDGPNLELRRNMLWRIAQRHEEDEPTTCITALKELNKMAGAYPVQQPQLATVTNITINNEALPRTKLDD